jgi:alpha-tubulin suppressor-like RCC1 family protein
LTYSGSNDPAEVGWYNANSGSTKPIGLKKPNELGLFDMTGNVAEWCWGTNRPRTSPRGGSCLDTPIAIFTPGSLYPETRALQFGFRLARNIGPKISISGTLPEATLNQAYAGYTFGAVGSTGDKVWSISEGTLPPGMSFSANGTLSGTPTTAGTYTFVIRLDSGGYWDEVEVELLVVVGAASNLGTIFSNQYAFAAIKSDGSVVSWGDPRHGGNSISVAASLSSNVTAIYSTIAAFAALKKDGSVVTWGNLEYGGNSTSIASKLSANVLSINSNYGAFAALKKDGSVVTWGGLSAGGNSSLISYNDNGPVESGSVAHSLSSNVTAIYSTRVSFAPSGAAFAALKKDGSVVTWGEILYGGDSSAVSSQLSGNIITIFSTGGAFAALKKDGSVVTWGDSGFGGNSTTISSQLSGNVTKIYSDSFGFYALIKDGAVASWGSLVAGGNPNLAPDVKEIFSTGGAFAALKNDGSVVTWGEDRVGGNSSVYHGYYGTYSSILSNLTSNVKTIYSNYWAFVAVKQSGPIVTWGRAEYGGQGPSLNSSDVVKIYSTERAFAALLKDGSVVTWGESSSGGSGGPSNIGVSPK